MKRQLDPRAEELLVERALRPLDAGELDELDRLLPEGDASFDAAAAAIALAAVPIEPMPAHVQAKILAAAPGSGVDFKRTLAGVAVGPSVPAPAIDLAAKREKRRRTSFVPWLAAAMSLLVAGGAVWWTQRARETPGVASPEQARAALVADRVAPIAWTASKDETARAAAGDVVWDQARQQGYMRFVGLRPNDPKQYQYQLWIFDKDRDAAFPVDGGVFDVSSTGEVIVPIAPKLHVGDATLFAVTVERPGGVVVSKRERIVVTAART
jgi:hypothetical protein